MVEKVNEFQSVSGGLVMASFFPISKAVGVQKGFSSQCEGFIDYAQVDAFTDKQFSGNPAVVCCLLYHKDAKWIQQVAAEFNVSQTAFLVKRSAQSYGVGGQCEYFNGVNGEGGGDERTGWKEVNGRTAHENGDGDEATVDQYDLRWFTPVVEVDLCGHATLAASYLLFASGMVTGSAIQFFTRSGLLSVRKVMDDLEWQGLVELDFPLVSTSPCPSTDLKHLCHTLHRCTPVSTGRTASGDFLVEVASAEEVAGMDAKMEEIMRCSGRGVLVTARASAESPYDFVSRFFCPRFGIDEDPVCGSAHCALAPYWLAKLGKQNLKAYQASKRGGALSLRVDNPAGRVYVRGRAVLVMSGVLFNWS